MALMKKKMLANMLKISKLQYRIGTKLRGRKSSLLSGFAIITG